MKFLAKTFSTFFGAGYFPVAPGTFASLVAALLYKFWLAHLAPPAYALVWLILTALGVLSSSVFSEELGLSDPGRIVVDEVSGQWLSLFMVPASWLPVLITFLLFRLFDVIKPYPIRKLEVLPRGWGIMADDLLAGIYAGILVHAYLILK